MKTSNDNAINRKLSTLTKGTKGSLDCVQVPTVSWYWPCSKAEIYHYDDGVFEAYPEATPGLIHPHHTIKVPAEDALEIEVHFDSTQGGWRVIHTTDRPLQWRDLFNQDKIEQPLLCRNEQHLRQTELKAGISTRSPLLEICENFGINSHSVDILRRVEYTTLELDPEMTAFFSALQTPEGITLPPLMAHYPPQMYK